jgi:hypothetical protein
MSSRRTQLSSAGVWEWHGDGPVQIGEPDRNISLGDVEPKEVIQDDIDKEENDICDCVKIYPENKNLST